MSLKPIRIVMLDDHLLFRKILRNFLTDQKDFTVIMQAASVSDFLHQFLNCDIDVLLMDVFMPQANGMEAFRIIRNLCPDIKILVLSMSVDISLVSDLLDLGIHGYVSKSEDPEELIKAIHSVAQGRIYRNRYFTEALYRNRQGGIGTDGNKKANLLSEREQKLVQLIGAEKNNKEIAAELFLSIRSIEKIRQDMKEKLGVRSTVGLLKYAMRQNIIKSIPNFSTSRGAEHFS